MERQWILLIPAVLLWIVTPAQGAQTPKAFATDRRTEIASLRNVLGDETLRRNDPDKVFSALERVSEINAVEALDEVISVLTIRRKLPGEAQGLVITLVTPEKRFPALSTLHKLGKCSVPALIDVIARTPPTSQSAQVAAYAISVIYSETPTVGSERVLDALFQYPEREAKLARFKAAALRIEKRIPPDNWRSPD